MKKGSIVQLKNDPKAGMARIKQFYDDIEGGVRLDKPLNGFSSWNIADLEEVTPDYALLDSTGRTWYVMERDDGSVVVYYTKENEPGQYVVWDSLDLASEK